MGSARQQPIRSCPARPVSVSGPILRTMVEISEDPAATSGRITAPLLWVYGTGAAGMALQVGCTAILARLLAPQVFGEIAAVMAVLRILQHVADMGLSTALIREADQVRARARTLILYSVLGSLLLAGLLWFAAPLLLLLEPQAHGSIAILRVLAFGPVLASIGQASAALLRHRLDFRRLGLAQLAAQLAGQVGVAIPLAAIGAGAWSLASGSLAQAAVLSALLLVLARPGWRGSLAVPADLLRLGFRYMLLRLLDAGGQAIPPLAMTAVAGLAATGFYDRAFVLTVVPLDWLAAGLAQVLFPIYVRQRSSAETAPFLLVSLALGGGLLFAVAAGMLMAKDYLVLAVLGVQWHASIPLLGWLAGWGFLRGLAVLNGSVVEARTSLWFRGGQQACYVACLAFVLFRGRSVGAEGFVMLLVAIEAVNVAVHVWHSSYIVGLSVWSVLRGLLAVLYPGLGIAAVLALLVPVLASWPAAAALATCIAVSAAILVMGLYWHPSARLRNLVRQLLRRQAEPQSAV